MQIFVATPQGSTAYDVDGATSVDSLKYQIENQEFVPSHLVCLLKDGVELEDGTLAGLGVEEEDTLTLTLDASGGMRKKWKKKRMRRLRRKRRKMRQRAR